jgi:hypothetical protein
MSIKKILNSQANRKIIYFFHRNPTSVDTLRGIVTWTGINRKEAARALEELAKKGVLIAHRVSSTVGYAYTSNKNIINKIKKYFQGVKGRI